jgi:LysM repeat protein
MRPVVFLPLVCASALLLACGAGSKSNANTNAKQPTDPKAVPTATLPAVLPSPIPAGTVTEQGITGQANTSPSTYVVKSGDTMAAIAQKLGVTLGQLQSYNNDVNPSSLKIGQELKVPPSPTPTPTASGLRPSTSTPASGTSTARTPTASSGGTSTPSASPAAGPGGTYTVQAGDTACKIATSNRVSLADLASANGTSIAALANLRVGQQLKLPATSSSSPGC